MKSLKGIRRSIRKRLRKEGSAYIENCMDDLNVLETIGREVWENMRDMQLYYSFENVFNESVALRLQEVALSYIFFRSGIELTHYGSTIEDIMDMLPGAHRAEDLLMDRMCDIEYEQSPTLWLMDRFGFKQEILDLDDVMSGNFKEQADFMTEDLQDVAIETIREIKKYEEDPYGFFVVLTRPEYTTLIEKIACHSKIYAEKLDRRMLQMYCGDMDYDLKGNDIQILLSFVRGDEFNGNSELGFKNETLLAAFLLLVFEEWFFMREKGWIRIGSGIL